MGQLAFIWVHILLFFDEHLISRLLLYQQNLVSCPKITLAPSEVGLQPDYHIDPV